MWRDSAEESHAGCHDGDRESRSRHGQKVSAHSSRDLMHGMSATLNRISCGLPFCWMRRQFNIACEGNSTWLQSKPSLFHRPCACVSSALNCVQAATQVIEIGSSKRGHEEIAFLSGCPYTRMFGSLALHH